MMSLTGWAITLLVVLWALPYAAVASAAVTDPGGSPCFHLHPGLYSKAYGCGRIRTLALANASDNGIEGSEEESEEAELEEEEAASAKARAEEADTRVASSHATPTSSPPANLRSGTKVVVVSQLRLTAKAASALMHHDPPASTVAFSFRLNTAARVGVTLFMRKSQGHRHWETLPDALTLSAEKGTVSRRLTGHNRLSPGRYRLTVKPIACT